MNSVMDGTQKSSAQPLSVAQVVRSLQLVLATRRAARNSDHIARHTLARGK